MKLTVLLAVIQSTSLSASEIISDGIAGKQLIYQTESLNVLEDAEEDFIQEQRKVIEDKQLRLWGIGLFSGVDLLSYGIQIATSSKWSHVATVLIDENGHKYSYESNGSAFQILYKHVLPQVQIHRWEDIVNNYAGTIATREFKFTDSSRNDPKVIQPYVYNRIGMPYQKDLTDLINAVFRANGGTDMASVFCSEETAHLLIQLRYLTNDRSDDNYLPKDFSQKEFIPLVDCSLGKETKAVTSGKNGCCIMV